MSESHFKYHTNCDQCGSSDGRAVYSNDSSYCFVCGHWEGSGEPDKSAPKPMGMSMSLLKYEIREISKRKIPEQIAQQFKYGFGHDKDGNLVHVANYYSKEKEIVGQKIRYPNKDFKFIGDSKASMMSTFAGI